MDADEVVMLEQDGSNYPNWSHFMSRHMIQTRRQLWDYVCGIVTEPNPGHENFTNLSQQWKTKNAEILNMICRYVVSPSVSIQLRCFKSGKEAWDYLAELYGHSNFAKKYQLETEIRATKQGDRTIKEFHGVMVGLWNQQAKLEDRDLSLLSSYKKNQDERLVQFLIALRDEFEPIRKSILCRLFPPSVEKAVRELEEEEMRLNKPSIVSDFSNLSIKTEDSFQIGKVKHDYSGGFDQSHKFNKPSSSWDRPVMSSSSSVTKTDDWSSILGGLSWDRSASAMSSSSSVTKTDDWSSILGGLAKVVVASFAAVQVSRTVYNYYTEPVINYKGKVGRVYDVNPNIYCYIDALKDVTATVLSHISCSEAIAITLHCDMPGTKTRRLIENDLDVLNMFYVQGRSKTINSYVDIAYSIGKSDGGHRSDGGNGNSGGGNHGVDAVDVEQDYHTVDVDEEYNEDNVYEFSDEDGDWNATAEDENQSDGNEILSDDDNECSSEDDNAELSDYQSGDDEVAYFYL